MNKKSKFPFIFALMLVIVALLGFLSTFDVFNLTVGDHVINLSAFLGTLITTAIPIAVFFFVMKLLKNESLLASNAPVFTEHVRVISKATTNSTSNRVLKAQIRTSSHSSCFVAFEFPNGIRKNFQVNVEHYNTIVEGEEGVLTYKEHEDRLWFVSFQPDSPN